MKVAWLLDELGLPYERLDVGGPFGGTDRAEYRAMNPTGLVPTLQEDGFALWESNAILRYLAHAHAHGAMLWPSEPRARAVIDQWLDWQQTTLALPQSTLFMGLVRTPEADRDMAAIDGAVARAGGLWSLLDARTAAHAYVAGPDFSLADIAIGPSAHRWFNLPIARGDTPHLRGWYERLLARPAYAAHVVAVPIT